MSKQRLKVAGVENIEITDPGRLTGRRKKIEPLVLQRLKGQRFNAAQLKSIFGYASTTALADTVLVKYIEPVEKDLKNLYQEKSTLWRVK